MNLKELGKYTIYGLATAGAVLSLEALSIQAGIFPKYDYNNKNIKYKDPFYVTLMGAKIGYRCDECLYYNGGNCILVGPVNASGGCYRWLGVKPHPISE